MARFEMNARDYTATAGAGASADNLFQLGLMYASGRGVEADLVAAHNWFNLAALRGNAAAKVYRMELAEEMTRSEVIEAQRQARQWMRRH